MIFNIIHNINNNIIIMSIILKNNYSKLISSKILDEINKLQKLLEHKNDNINTDIIITKYKDYIYNYLGLSFTKYKLFITNGYKSYSLIYDIIPILFNTKIHIIILNTDESILSANYKKLLINNKIEITILTPNKYGYITVDEITNVKKKNTKLIIIPYSNKELGTINNIKDIYSFCKINNILYFSNINDLFGYNNTKNINNIDIIFATFDKIYGPTNISILLIKKKLLNQDIINFFNQSNYFLNNKKNIPLISGSLYSLLHIIKNREEKNTKIKNLKLYLLDKLSQILPILKYTEYYNLYTQSIIKLTLIIINDSFIDKSNTILFSIFSNKIKISNNNISKSLEQNNIQINNLSSNIINSINYDNRIKNGLISITIGDHNKQSDINNFIKYFIEAIKVQYNNIYDEIKDNIIVNKKLSQKKIKKVVRFSNPICIDKQTKKHNFPKLKSILIL